MSNSLGEPEYLLFYQHKVSATQPLHFVSSAVFISELKQKWDILFVLLLADSIVLLLTLQWSHFCYSSPCLYLLSLMHYFTLSFLLSAVSLRLCSSITRKGSDGCSMKWLIPKQCVLGKPVPFQSRECVVLWDLVREQKRSLGYCII